MKSFNVLKISMNTELTGFIGFCLNGGETDVIDAPRGEIDTGLKITTTIKSDLEIDGTIQMKAGELVKLAWNLPRDKMNLIRIR